MKRLDLDGYKIVTPYKILFVSANHCEAVKDYKNGESITLGNKTKKVKWCLGYFN